MKALVVYAHPNDKSFNHAIKDEIILMLKEKNAEIRINDLYKEKFNPVLAPSDFEKLAKGTASDDVLKYQTDVKWSEIIIFIYPIWWASMPAILKGYIDRVFSHGFAYKSGKNGVEGQLSDKKVFVINTTGSPFSLYSETGMHDAIKKLSDFAIFDFCGIKDVKHLFFGAVPSVDDATRKSYLESMKSEIKF